MIELDAFADVEPLRDDFLITAVEHYMGLPWRACQCMLLHDHRQDWLRMRQAPPGWFMHTTRKKSPRAKAAAIARIDSYIHDIDRLVHQFERSLSPEVLRTVAAYRALGDLRLVPDVSTQHTPMPSSDEARPNARACSLTRLNRRFFDTMMWLVSHRAWE
jgi:hypothetical protein